MGTTIMAGYQQWVYKIVQLDMVWRVYLVGLVFLLFALAINVLGKALKLPSWYDFLANPKINLLSAVWLFVLYPLLLGILVLVLKKFL